MVKLKYFDIFELVFGYAFLNLWISETNYFYKNKVLLYFCRYHLPTLTNPLLLLYLLPDSLICMLISIIPFFLGYFFYNVFYFYFLYLVFNNIFQLIFTLGLTGLIYYCVVCFACYTRFKREKKNIEEKVKNWDVNQDSTFLKPKDKK